MEKMNTKAIEGKREKKLQNLVASVALMGIAIASSMVMVVSAGDDGIKEVGVEWVNDYPGTADDRSHWDESANGLYNKLVGEGWTGRFNWGNYWAWEKDFKRMDLGGTNENWIDSVDIALVGAHGSTTWDAYYGKTLSCVYLGTTHDDPCITPSDARGAWGNNDLEWIALDSCSVLRDSSRGYWANTMDGLHLILGFKNTMYVISYGDGRAWAEYMVDDGWWDWPRTVTQAWFSAVDDRQPTGVTARVLAEVHDNYNDYLHDEGYVSPDPSHNSGYWYWDHSAGSEPPLQVSSGITKMMLYKVVDRTVDEEYVRSIGERMKLPEGEVGSDRRFYYMGDKEGKVLQVDRITGIYKYQDLNSLWNANKRPEKLPSSENAQERAKEYLKEVGLLPGDAVFYEVITEGPAEVEYSIDKSGNLHEDEGEKHEMDRQVVFARHLESGRETLSVVGPGAKLKVYIGAGEEIIGAQGGWRDVEPSEEIEIMTSDEAWKLLEVCGPKVCLMELPYYDDLKVKETTLGYFEESWGKQQTYLIPVYIFSVDFIVERGEASSGYVYVPAAKRFL